ncbi:MAG: TPM domain-containing protein [Gammaproteobacteria bacterium]|nr:TPM domain-containing protein [Gammaproteobacteria bacterium]
MSRDYHRRWVQLLAIGVVFWLFATGLQAAPDFPELTGRVVDTANLLSNVDEQQLTQQLKAHEDKTTNQVVVVTLNTLQGYDIADYGYQLGRHWGIGQADENNGVLLIVAPNQRKTRIEVGYGLEGTLTDSLSKQIIDYEMIPRFKKEDFAGGIKNGTAAITGILSGSIDAKAFKKSRPVKKNYFQKMIGFIFITLILGFFLKAWLGIFKSSMVVFGGNLGIGYLMSGLEFGFLVALASTVVHLFNNIDGGRGGRFGGGYYGGGYGSGGGFGSGGFGGGGGSFGGGGASGGW